MGLFSGLKTIKKAAPPQPEKTEVPQDKPKGFDSSTAYGLYNPKDTSTSAPSSISTPIASGDIATVGDGGASWKRRALLRAKQKADQTGKSLREVVTDLHGTTVKEMATASKGAYEKWKGPRKSFHKPRDSTDNSDSTDRRDVRGGGLRLGRNLSDADVLKRFKGKVSDGFKRSGLSGQSVQENTKKRDREVQSEIWDKSKFEEVLKQSEVEEENEKKRTRMKTENIWDEPDSVRTPHQKQNLETSSVDSASHNRISTTPIIPVSSGNTSSGNLSAAAALRARLTTPKSAPNDNRSGSSQLSTSGESIAAPLDREGRRLLALLESDQVLDRKEDFKKGKWRGKAKGEAAAAGGEEGAKRMDISTMAAFEREGGEDMDEVFARNISRLGGRFKGTEDKGGSRAGMDEEEEVDMKMYQNVNERVTSKKLIEIQRNKAVAEERRYSSMMSNSPFSVENPHFKHRLVVARGNHCYLMLVEKKKRLVSGHCYIVALQQSPSSRAVQEEVWDEMVAFKAALRRCFGGQGKGVLFLETAMIKSGRAWAHVECLPVPVECEEDAPLYFKQSISGAESEWSTHRAIIDTARGLRKCIPIGFPYFHVEWARGGIAHVIEDSEEFGEDFGHAVVAGMLGLDHHIKGSSAQLADSEIESFKANFAPFNPAVYR